MLGFVLFKCHVILILCLNHIWSRTQSQVLHLPTELYRFNNHLIKMPKRKSKQKRETGDATSTSPRKQMKNDKGKKPGTTPAPQPISQEQCDLQKTDCLENDKQGARSFPFTTAAETFARLIHPIGVDSFFKDYWEKQPLVIRSGRENRTFFGSLFSRTILEDIVAERRVAFARDCNMCRYKGGKRESLNGQGAVKVKQLQNLLDKSRATVQFHQPQRFQDSIWRLLEHLETFFGCLVGSNVYMTPRGSQGLAPHYDDVEVFVLQLEGEKRWRLYDPPITLPRNYSPDLDQSEIGSPTHNIILEPGDVLYFPRGIVHQAETPDTSSHSTHLTISTYQRTAWADLLGIALPSILKTAISEALSFREGLPIGFHSNGQASGGCKITRRLKDMICRLGDHVGSHGREAANEMLCEFIGNRLPPFCDGELDFSPCGPMPTLKNVIRFRFPDHVFVVRRDDCGQREEHEDEEEEEEEEVGAEEFQLFVYHSLQPSRHDHMMSDEPKQAKGIQLPTECESSLRALLKSDQAWHRVADIKLEEDVRSQMLTSLWAEGLLEVQDA